MNTELRMKYDQKSKEVELKLLRLKRIVEKHRSHYQQSPNNWGFLGDLINLENRLDELINFTRM